MRVDILNPIEHLYKHFQLHNRRKLHSTFSGMQYICFFGRNPKIDNKDKKSPVRSKRHTQTWNTQTVYSESKQRAQVYQTEDC